MKLMEITFICDPNDLEGMSLADFVSEMCEAQSISVLTFSAVREATPEELDRAKDLAISTD